MKNLIAWCTLAVALVLVCWAAHAPAATTGDSDTTGLILTDFDLTLSVDQFDPALGTLNQVTLTISGQVFGGAKYENLNDYAVDDTMHHVLDQDVTVTKGLVTKLFDVEQHLDNIVPVVADPYDGVLDFAGPSGYTQPGYTQSDSVVLVYTLPGELSPFIGTGTVDYNATGDATATVAPPNLVVGGSFSFGEATIQVEYDYTPIPEPGVLVLMALGVVALLRRKRR